MRFLIRRDALPCQRLKAGRESRLKALLRRLPDRQGDDRCNGCEITIGSQHHQFVSDAQLRQQRIDGPGLDTLAAAAIPQFRRANVIGPVRHDQRQSREAIDYLPVGLRFTETLQQLLQDEAGADHPALVQRIPKPPDFREVRRPVAAQRQ